MIKEKYTCLVYGEGRNDRRFLQDLIGLDKFKYHTSNWFFSYGNAKGVSTEIVLKECKRSLLGRSYNLVLCFVDLDDLKNRFPVNWEEKQKEIEEKNSKLVIVWQIDNAEDEYGKVLGKQGKNKFQLNKIARKQVKRFINSSFWHRILGIIKEKESNLNDQE